MQIAISKRLAITLLLLFAFTWKTSQNDVQEEEDFCVKRQYSYIATKKDVNGKRCDFSVTAIACYGFCWTGTDVDDNGNMVTINRRCLHDRNITRTVEPEYCDEGASDDIKVYTHLDAISCSCMRCNQQSTHCKGSGKQKKSGSNSGSGRLRRHRKSHSNLLKYIFDSSPFKF